MTADKIISVPESTAGVADISKDLLSACIHCGLCLPACPTYLASGRETESPRGRIYLLNEWNENRLDLTHRLTEHIDSCLGCLGCQTACPSGVQYEKILNQARPAIAAKRPFWYRTLIRTAFSKVLPDYALLKTLGSALRYYELSGLKECFGKLFASLSSTQSSDAPHLVSSGRNLFSKLAVWQEFMPSVPVHTPLPQRSWRHGAKSGSVQFFSGCVMDVFYNDVNHACMRLLKAQSKIVENPAQTCCGALAFHAGEVDITIDLAKKNIELFEKTEGDIVVSAAGCGAMLKEYSELLHAQPEWAERAHQFSARVKDITQSLSSGEFTGLPDQPSMQFDAAARKVAYHAACHLAHAQKVHTDPLILLNRLVDDCKKLEKPLDAPQIVPLMDSEHCCGSAGIYNILHPDMALAVLANKMDAIEKTGADLVVTTNPGCMLQLEAGIRTRGLKVQVKHLAELLDDFYCSET